jgi:F0F1-type ATP synthase membrane subunit c/vacuolar-type H+-ATPase subunit K
MGPFLLTGLALAGAAIGIGYATASARSGSGLGAAQARAVAIIGLAFAQGIGVLGVVVGILAIMERDAGDTNSGIVIALVAGAGAAVGLAVVARASGAERTIRALGLMYVVGNALLGIVVGILAAILGTGTALGFDAVFVILGLVAFAAAIMMGRTTAGALAALSSSAADAVEIRRRFLIAVAPSEILGVLAVAGAIVLLILGGDGRRA